jgi:glycosyltransferase involved in cell wall biosynthesis
LIGALVYHAVRISEKLSASAASAVITVDDNLASKFSNHNKPVVIIGHYPQKLLIQSTNRVFIRSEISLLYAGRISLDRGVLLYIDILRYLRNWSIPARLILAGTHTPVSEEQIINKYSYDLQNYIEYLGWISYEKISDVYQKADVGLSILLPEPRYILATPVKLFEYMASGLPVIASNFPSITSIVNKTECGICVDPLSDPVEIAHIIENWFHNPTIPQKLGENGKQAILTKYNWENQAWKIVNLYDQLLK